MRTSLILAMIAVVTPVTVGAEPLYAVYSVLKDHPACTGPGHIAYEATFDVKIDEAGVLRGDAPEVCSIRTRRGGSLMEVPVPCDEGDGRRVRTENSWKNFCSLTAELRPVEISLEGALTGCITVTGHSFVDGDWTATTVRPSGTKTLSGAHDDPRLEATYYSSSTGTQELIEPSIGLWVQLEDETVRSLPGSVVEVAAAAVGINAIRLVDGSQPGCAKDPASCWRPPESAKVSITKQEYWPVCAADGSGLKFGIGRDVPAKAGN
jgi:hypothetical protein